MTISGSNRARGARQLTSVETILPVAAAQWDQACSHPTGPSTVVMVLTRRPA